jgi:7-keto-8-aminopelargonate synthetase-like enzyme
MSEVRDNGLGALGGSMRDFRYLPGTNILDRVNSFYEWQELRRETGLWPLGRSTETAPRSKCVARNDEGENRFEGINFASQDYLSLSSHPAMPRPRSRSSTITASTAPARPPIGNTSHSIALEKKIAEFLETDEVVLFPTGWAAGFGVVKGLVRPSDHIVMDALSHACLQEGAQASTRNIHYFRHNSIEAVRQKLTGIRAKDNENGILIITESLFSMDSDTPDIAALQELAHEFGATLVVDVAHDLGCARSRGPRPYRRAEHARQGRRGDGELLQDLRVERRLRRLQPAQREGISALLQLALHLLERAFAGPGRARAQSLRNRRLEGRRSAAREPDDNIRLLRELLHGTSFETYGDPSPIVCVKMGSEGLARLVSRRLPEHRAARQPCRVPGRPEGSGAVPHAGHGQPQQPRHHRRGPSPQRRARRGHAAA